MYTNVVQHFNCQCQDNFSTLNITLNDMKSLGLRPFKLVKLHNTTKFTYQKLFHTDIPDPRNGKDTASPSGKF